MRWNEFGVRTIYFSPDDGGSGGGPTSASSGAGDGGSTTPSTGSSAPPGVPASSTPSTPSPPSADLSTGSEFDFETIFGTGEPSAPPVAAPTPAPVVPSAAPQAPAAQPVTPPTGAEPAAQAAPAAQPGAPAPSAPGPQASLPSPDEPASLAAYMQQNQEAMVNHIAENVFKLSPQDVEALESDAVAVIPKLMARSFVMAQQNFLMHLSKSVPLMLAKHLKITERNKGNTDRFYQRWPDIDANTHKDLVNRIAHTYRQANPNATLEQMIEDLGPLVMTIGKIVPKGPRSAAPGQRPNGRTPPPAPFVPSGAMGAISQPSGDDSDPWGFLAPGNDGG